MFALAAIAATSAFAQSTVTLSGQLNAGYGKAISTSATKAGIINNTANGTNITLAAVEDLGGGLKATADVNIRFNSADGTNVSNTTTALGATKDAFAQNVALGVTGSFGTIKTGRFTSGIAAPIGAYDPFGTDAHGVAVTTPGSGAPARSNGTIQYTSPVFNGFKVTAETAFASNAIAAGGKDSTQYVLSYAQGAVSAMVGGGTLATNDSISAFAASYDLGMVKPSIAYVKVGDTKKETAFGISAPMGAATIKAGYRTLAYGTAEDINTTAVGVTYALSKRTSVIADFAQTKQTGAANQSGYVLGMRHAF